ncbi:ABC transporter ATP-binding protein [Marinobacter sp. F3R08]|uniref:ABC transporter ATP-binding protein n=1 Tax=Marinobacter sp. F3R08 TaxID=2841559 RepID=UPI001C08EDDC|nr:ABC transporter ATP-binding protein [Marinobacter sp. F3R08]MBU2954465.1 ABC transporter ATP-binding protein [Marinobacter sp. F3R08]
MSVLSVQRLTKEFREFSSEWKRVATWFGVPVRPVAVSRIINDITFEVGAGEAVGLVGQNGAGKSTLLKLITGTLQPSGGNVVLNGRVSAILELGMGFNPELSGRQNVYHAASIMGFGKAEVDEAIDRIEAFAEVGAYFDEPVRTYSSGMQVRVAFAVATAWRPDVLIVDEALSVGDSYFQHKSFGRIREFQAEGTTLLIVSHDRTSIQALCDRVLLLEKGAVIKDGAPEEVMDFYNALIAEKENSTVKVKKLDSGKVQTQSGTGEAKIEDIALFNARGEMAEYIEVGENVELRISVKVHKPISSLVLGYGIKDRLGQVMYGTNTWHSRQAIVDPEVGSVHRFVIAFPANLGVGSYSVVTALHAMDSHIEANYEWRDLAMVFNVVNVNRMQFQGCNWIEPKITV